MRRGRGERGGRGRVGVQFPGTIIAGNIKFLNNILARERIEV